MTIPFQMFNTESYHHAVQYTKVNIITGLPPRNVYLHSKSPCLKWYLPTLGKKQETSNKWGDRNLELTPSKEYVDHAGLNLTSESV